MRHVRENGSMARHVMVLGLSMTLLVVGSVLKLDKGGVLLGSAPLPSVCWLRGTPVGGCPGCGLTHSVIAFCHLRPALSLKFHPAGWLVTLLAVLQLPYRTTCMLAAEQESLCRAARAMGRFMLLVTAGLAVTSWLARVIFC